MRRRPSTRWRCSVRCPAATRSLPLRRQAGAIAERVFARSPNHPGAAHYILHAYDHVTLAPKGLAAARAYAKIAPAASHALHMPAHAFLQLGLWDEAASADQASWNASIAWAKRRGLPVASRDFHSLSWLQYEWTQQGRFSKTKEALAFVDEAMTRSPTPLRLRQGYGGKQAPKPSSPLHTGAHESGESVIGRASGPAALRNDRGSMRARYIIESERWSEMKGQSHLRQHRRAVRAGIERGQPGRRAAGPLDDRPAAQGRGARRNRRSCASRRRSCCARWRRSTSLRRDVMPTRSR